MVDLVRRDHQGDSRGDPPPIMHHAGDGRSTIQSTVVQIITATVPATVQIMMTSGTVPGASGMALLLAGLATTVIT
jgi:hypothetical protein